VKAFVFVADPFGAVTSRVTTPEAPDGVVTTADVADVERIAAAEPPNVTDERNARFVPVIVTDVPPDVPPDVTDRVEIVGAAA